MNFLGMGPMEILVIAVVGLIIFGPGKLPEVAGQVGKAVRDFRRLTTDLSSEFEKTAGLNELKQSVQKEIAGIQSEVSGVTAGVKKDLQSSTSTVKKTGTSTASKATPSPAVKSSATSAAKTTSTAAKTSTTAKTTTPAKPEPVKASKADPLADVSFLDDLPAVKAAPKPVVATIPAASAPAPEVNDALARARARRQQAGYNRAAHL